MRIHLILIATAMLAACSDSHDESADAKHSARAEAGAALFSDPRLGTDGATSCASCHSPDQAFADGRRVSVGVDGLEGARNAPSLLDLGAFDNFFWDGREHDLPKVVLQAFTNPRELGHGDMQPVLDTIRADPGHSRRFKAAFGHGTPDHDDVAQALVAFLDTLERGETRYERALHARNLSLLSEDEIAGLALFEGKAECSSCHVTDAERGPSTDNRFHHTGIGFERVAGQIAPLTERITRTGTPIGHLILEDPDVAELGRYAATRRAVDIGAFRTPTLRNIGNTAPYMHDGSIETLEDAIERELYYRGIARGRPIQLTAVEQRQLAAFLRSLDIE